MYTGCTGVDDARVDLPYCVVAELEFLHTSRPHVLDTALNSAHEILAIPNRTHMISAFFTRSRKTSLPLSCFKFNANDLLFRFTAENKFDMGPFSFFQAPSSPDDLQYLESSCLMCQHKK
jgi:hypothetical protein